MKHRSRLLDIASIGQHAVGQKPLGHPAPVEGHPARHELAQILLEPGSVVA